MHIMSNWCQSIPTTKDIAFLVLSIEMCISHEWKNQILIVNNQPNVEGHDPGNISLVF